MEVESGTLNLWGSGRHTGQFIVDAGATFGVMGGTHDFDVASLIAGPGDFYVNAPTANLAGTVNVTGNHTFHNGTANITGNYNCASNTLNIDGRAVVNFNGTGLIAPDVLNLSQGGTLSGSNLVTVSGPLNLGNAFGFSGSGMVVANGGLNIFGGGGSSDGRTLVNNANAVWNRTAGSTLVFINSATFSNAPGATFEMAGDGIFRNSAGSNRFVNAGTFRKTGGTASAEVYFPFLNSGTVELNSGTLDFAGGGYFQSDGVTRLRGGSLASRSPIQINGGVLEGSGIVAATVMNSGIIRLGKLSSASVLRSLSNSDTNPLIITGDYIQTADGVLELEVGGSNPGQVIVSNSVTLGGTLNLNLADGATLQPNASIPFITSSKVTGSFSQINTSVTNAAVQLVVQGTNVSVQVANVRPTLTPISDQTILSSTTFRLATHTTDPDLPPQTLTYRLINSPPTAVIDTNGVITWTPSASAPRTNAFSVVVTDSGRPRLSAVQAFNVILSDRAAAPSLSLTASATDSHTYVLSLVGTPGSQYIAQYSTNLPGLWFDFATNSAAADGHWSALDAAVTNRARFYRVRSGPR